MAIPRSEILKKLNDLAEKGIPIIGGGAGTGISAKSEEAGGIDLIVIYNTGRYRMAGRVSLTGLFAYSDANSVMMEMAGEVIQWDFQADFYISINILNQLDILLIDYIQKQKLLNPDQEKQLRKIIQTNHIRSLPEGKSCIITDFEEILYNKEDNVETKRPLIYADLPEGRFSEQWQWNFDLNKTYYPGKKTIFNVTAIDF